METSAYTGLNTENIFIKIVDSIHTKIKSGIIDLNDENAVIIFYFTF